MLGCIFSCIFSLLYYAVILAVLGYLFVAVTFCGTLLRTNEFPKKRKFCTSSVQLNGKTVIVTGGHSSLIGYETSKEFAKRGARVILPCRSLSAGAAAKDKLIAETGNKDIEVMVCDLADLESVKSFCKNFMDKESRLDILVANAAFIRLFAKRERTVQGFEKHVGVNHVGHFLMVYLLLDMLKQSAPSRIVIVSSNANLRVPELDLKPKDEHGNLFPNMQGYYDSKLLNVLHAKYLARILQGTGVTTYSVHPGYIVPKKGMAIRNVFSALIRSFRPMLKLISLTGEQGAQTMIHCALEESLDTSSGKYYANCEEKKPNPLADDHDLAKRVWDATLDLVKDVALPS